MPESRPRLPRFFKPLAGLLLASSVGIGATALYYSNETSCSTLLAREEVALTTLERCANIYFLSDPYSLDVVEVHKVKGAEVLSKTLGKIEKSNAELVSRDGRNAKGVRHEISLQLRNIQKYELSRNPDLNEKGELVVKTVLFIPPESTHSESTSALLTALVENAANSYASGDRLTNRINKRSLNLQRDPSAIPFELRYAKKAHNRHERRAQQSAFYRSGVDSSIISNHFRNQKKLLID